MKGEWLSWRTAGQIMLKVHCYKTMLKKQRNKVTKNKIEMCS